MSQVIEILNPNAFLDPTFQAFVGRAVGKSILRETPLEALLPVLADKVVLNPRAALHVVVEGGRFEGLAITFLPSGPLDVVPRVTVFYLEKGRSRGAKGALLQALVDFIRAAGYTRAWVINGSGARDSVWKRAFRGAGPAKRIGSVLEVDLTPAKQGKEAKNGRSVRRQREQLPEPVGASGRDPEAVPGPSGAAGELLPEPA